VTKIVFVQALVLESGNIRTTQPTAFRAKNTKNLARKQLSESEKG